MMHPRIVHISDTHLGKRQYGSALRCAGFSTAFEQAVDIAVERDVERDVDAVIHTGDLFDGPQPPLQTVIHVVDTLDPPTEHEILFDGIVGNHDRRTGHQWLDLVRSTNAVRPDDFEMRPLVAPATTTCRRDAVAHVRDALDRHDLLDAVVKIELADEDGVVTANQVAQKAHDTAVASGDVDDTRGHVDCPVEEQASGMRQTAQNAVETAALRSLRRRAEGETAPAAQNATETATDDGTTDELERDAELHDDMTDERDDLIRERDRLEAELSELDAAIDDIQDEIDAIKEDLAVAVTERDTATETFLPDDRLPESVTNDTRDTVASYLDTLSEKRDVLSEEVAMTNAQLKVERKNAADAREDIEEIAAVVNRLEDRTDEAESMVQDAREKLDDARSQFADALATLASRLADFDIDLSAGTLAAGIDARIPERSAALQASIEEASARVAELSARESKLAADRDKLQSIDGGGTCPTCSQHVGPERTESEVAAIEEELGEIERQLDVATQERAELSARREELDDLRKEAIDLRSFRSETVAEAAGRVEDRQENFEDLQADLEEERAELAEVNGERDEADAAIARLESEKDALETEIDRLESVTGEGETSIEAFRVVDELRQELEALIDERSDLQGEYTEMEAEREWLDAEIAYLT